MMKRITIKYVKSFVYSDSLIWQYYLRCLFNEDYKIMDGR